MKYKNIITLTFAAIIIAASVFVCMPVQNVLADPVPTCGAGASLKPGTNGNPAYCACPTGQFLVTIAQAGLPANSCAASCPSGTTQTAVSSGNPQVSCNDTDAAQNTPSNGLPSGCVVGNEKECASAYCSGSSCSDTNATKEGSTCNTDSCDLVTKYVNPLIKILSGMVGIVIVISIIIGGIQYSASSGDPAAVTAAKNRIRNSIIAFLAFIFLFSLLQFLIPGGIFKTASTIISMAGN